MIKDYNIRFLGPNNVLFSFTSHVIVFSAISFEQDAFERQQNYFAFQKKILSAHMDSK